jgi:hypothetical protein
MAPRSREPPRRTDPWDREERRREVLDTIQDLQSRSNRGVWSLCLFLTVSIAARWDFRFLPALPEKVHVLLGRPPPTSWISVALVAYSFSALVLTLSRMMSGEVSRGGLAHVGYLTAFYGFYYFAGGLPDNFWAVFAAGLTILGLEAYNVWNRSSELIQEEMQKLDILDAKLPKEPREKDF